jgi:AP-2 complex subunit mu-1
MLAVSGLRVTYLKILERRLGEYKVDRWMRKMTRSGDYLVRT